MRTANIRDCLELGPNLRIEDKSEVMAVAGLDPTTGLLQSFTGSNECLTVVLEGDPIAMLGVGHCALGDDIGMIWMLASPKLFEVTQAFIRHSKRFIETLGGPYTILMNYVDCRNTGHIRWLRWCGFTFIAKHDDFGVGKLPFYEFVRI